MRAFPLPVRLAAGLAATTVEQTRQLPRQLVGLPITVASQALQLSMRLRQQVTTLAIKGDEALASCSRTEEKPGWATFDEDEQTVPPGPPGEREASTVRREPEANSASEVVTDDLAVLPDYDHLTLPQLRGKLGHLSEQELTQLLEYERAHGQRSEFLRMLSNRLERVRSHRS